jgi:hypothetical protein
MNPWIKQVPAFNLDYFILGKAVRITDKTKNKKFDGLILRREEDRIGVSVVEWYSPMTGTSEYIAQTCYFDIKDIVNEKYEIELL